MRIFSLSIIKSIIMKKDKSAFESPDRLNRLVEGTKLIGELITDSNIRVDGEIEGNLTCAGKVVVGESAKIEGNLTCGEADIEGNVLGDINVEGLLILRSKSKTEGTIQTGKLEVNQGAVFFGTCQMAGQALKSKSKGAVDKSKKLEGDLVY